jgi:hypothetical protein
MKNIILPCLLLALLVYACSKPAQETYYNLPVHNNAPYAVTVWCSTAFPDTTIPATPTYACSADANTISYLYSTTDWDKVLNGIPKGIMYAFIVSKDTINKYGANDVKANYRILKRIAVNKGYLGEKGNSIVYP